MTEQTGGVLIVAEVHAGEPRAAAWELISAGRSVAGPLGSPLTLLVLGSNCSEAAQQLGAAGVDRVLLADQESLAGHPSDVTTAAVSQVIERERPCVVLISGTTAGRDYAPRVAARLKVGLAADCVQLDVEDGALVAVRPILGGRVQTAVRLAGSSPQMATVRPGSFEKAEATGNTPEIESVVLQLPGTNRRITIRETAAKEMGSVNLEAAETIVSGGRGLKEPDNFKLVEELAAALDAAVGASRAVVDAGWRPHHEQVGQTGRTVAPRLYVAVGISGAVQHLVGMQGADYIVAINRDPDAPIFKIASFGIVGDLFEIVPAVTEAIKAARG
ncbi:MAG: electron transfer flavoprotein subunit alpha/FixB family protein [Chloroflexia bacterium]|nr:electron transfer flavoprotein subunit alpha/FixB family protein [Chloroflexia bacterium]